MVNKNKVVQNYPKVFNAYELNNPFGARGKKNYKFIIILILIIVLVGIAVYYLFFSSIFIVKNIIIQNSENVNISQELNSLKGENIFKINTSGLTSKLVLKYPEVSGLKIARGLPDTLKIYFDERQSKLVWQTDEKKYLVDNQGTIYKLLETPNDLPLVVDNKNVPVKIGQTVASINFLKFTSDLTAILQDKTGYQLKQFELNDTIYQVNVVTNQRWNLIFDTTRLASDQIDALNQFLKDYPEEEIKDYIDLRVEGRVYYK